MRLLVLGGTVFLGRAVVAEALARDWDVTIFHRGRHNTGVFGGAVDERFGDRTKSLRALGEEDEWDLVVDTSGFVPEDVDRSARFLEHRVARYVFVSTAGVYRDWPARAIADERAPVLETGDDYSANKAACERALGRIFKDRALSARAGIIVGPYENIGRLPYWLRRIARGGFVLAPGPREARLQWIDVRDLAGWMLDTDDHGPVNAVSPPEWLPWEHLLETCRRVVNPSAELRWVDGARVAPAVEDPWSELPLWPSPVREVAGVYSVGTDRARASGLLCRPPEQTVADTWAWLRRAEPDEGMGWRIDVQAAGLDADRERALLAELARGQDGS